MIPLRTLFCCTLLVVPLHIAATEPQPLDGLWNGRFDINGKGDYDFQAVYLGGRVAAWSVDTNVVYRGNVTGDDKTYQSNMDIYIRDGSKISSVELNGTVENNATSILANYETTGDDTGTLRLTYNPLFEQPPALQTLEGLWEFSGKKLSISVNFDDAGTLKGTDSVGCNYYGKLSQIRPGINTLDVQIEIASCSTTDGKYEGMAYLAAPAEGVSDTLHLSMTGEYFGMYYPLQRTLTKP